MFLFIIPLFCVNALEAGNKNSEELVGKAMFGNIEKVQKLINDGFSPDSHDFGYTALMAASHSGKKEVVSLLLKHGANPNINNDGTAIMPTAMNV